MMSQHNSRWCPSLSHSVHFSVVQSGQGYRQPWQQCWGLVRLCGGGEVVAILPEREWKRLFASKATDQGQEFVYAMRSMSHSIRGVTEKLAPRQPFFSF